VPGSENGLAWFPALVAFPTVPIAVGIAVLRYRLYEIDRIISRTIAWAVVTGVLVGVFFGAVVALQALLTDFTQGETVAVAASTLVAAAVFQPLRRRVQRAVDRRFDRAAYDARQTVEAFARRLRDEVALDAVVTDLLEMVATSMKPTSLALWLRPAAPRPSSPP
jgi:DNA integrity scanning protein DisA with diadenylate cyclase activity